MRRADSLEVLRVGDSSPSSVESSFRELDDVFLQTQTRIWLGEVLHTRFDDEMVISDLLADGEFLFQVSKVVWKMLQTKYGEIKYSKAHIYERASGRSGGRYMPYSNVDAFLKICQLLGLTGVDLFSPSDVVEKRDTRRVCMCVRSLSKKARSKQLNVPDFDVVTYTIAMPTDMVGCIRRSLERGCSFSSSFSCSPCMGSKEKYQVGSDCSGQDDLSSEGSDEAESNFRGLEFQSPVSDTIYGEASLSNLTAEISPGGISVVEENFGMTQDMLQLDGVNQNKDGLMDFLHSHAISYTDRQLKSAQLIASPQSCLKCQVDLKARTCCSNWSSVEPINMLKNDWNIGHDLDCPQTCASSEGDLSAKLDGLFILDSEEMVGHEICSDPIQGNESCRSPLPELDPSDSCVILECLENRSTGTSVASTSVNEVGDVGLSSLTSLVPILCEPGLANGPDQYYLGDDFIIGEQFAEFRSLGEVQVTFQNSMKDNSTKAVKLKGHAKSESLFMDSNEKPEDSVVPEGSKPLETEKNKKSCLNGFVPHTAGQCIDLNLEDAFVNGYLDGYPDHVGEDLVILADSLSNASIIRSDNQKKSLESIANESNGHAASLECGPSRSVSPTKDCCNFEFPQSNDGNSEIMVSVNVPTALYNPDMGLDVSHSDSLMNGSCCSLSNKLGYQGELPMDHSFDDASDKVKPCLEDITAADNILLAAVDAQCEKSDANHRKEDWLDIEKGLPTEFVKNCFDIPCKSTGDLETDKEILENVLISESISSPTHKNCPCSTATTCIDGVDNVHKCVGGTKTNEKDVADLGDLPPCGGTISHKEEVDYIGNMDKDIQKLGLDPRDERRAEFKPNKKQLLKSVAGGVTLIGALFVILQLSRRGKVKVGEPSVISQRRKATPERPLEGKVGAVYPGEKLKL